VTAVMLADAVTTSRIQYHPNLSEGHPLARLVLGSQPETSDTYLYFGTLMVTSYLIARALPARWRPYWHAALLVDFGTGLAKNCVNGLC